LETYEETKTHHSLVELKKFYMKTIHTFEQYTSFLEHMNCVEYLEEIKNLQEKTKRMTIKLIDVKKIKMKE
jgi:hypothetical protein